MTTLRETIRSLTAQHLDAGHIVCGQNLTAVGFVGGTLPETHAAKMTELPNSDVADAGFAVGMALAGRRPIYVLRYQGFAWFAQSIVNYAAKSKALWGRPCPVLVRGIAMEGGIGPTSGSSHHSLFTRMPGIRVRAPMTPAEWRACYEEFMAGDDPMYLSEHRGAYDDTNDSVYDVSFAGDWTSIILFPISIAVHNALVAAHELLRDGINASVQRIVTLRPFDELVHSYIITTLHRCQCGIVIDDDYPGGVASDIAMQLHEATGAKMRVLGLKNKTAGFGPGMDNLPPGVEEIKAAVKEMLR